MANDTCNLNFNLPRELRERARAEAKRSRSSTTHLIIASLTKHLDDCDERRRLEEERRVAILTAKEAQKRRSSGPSARILGAPLAPVKSLVGEDTAPRAALTRFQRAVEEGAKNILAAGSDAVEAKHRVFRAVDAVKKACPLLHPPDREILCALENAVVRLREDADDLAPGKTGVDDLVEAVIDVSRIKTRGDVLPEDP